MLINDILLTVAESADQEPVTTSSRAHYPNLGLRDHINCEAEVFRSGGLSCTP